MSYISIYDAATDEASTLRKQVAVALHKAAVDVSNEAEGTTNHSARLTWARKVLASGDAPVIEAGAWIWKVMANPTILADPANATDINVTNAVNGIINTMAAK
jgi:hypothetical protein